MECRNGTRVVKKFNNMLKFLRREIGQSVPTIGNIIATSYVEDILKSLGEEVEGKCGAKIE